MIVEYIRKGQDKRKTNDMPKEECEHYVEVLKGHLKEDLVKVEIKEK
jgi:hypothetical protein|tara:strand:+ start:814 stop:954 length:141 start_codon:yes stop_codon:yes gene_type:complete